MWNEIYDKCALPEHRQVVLVKVETGYNEIEYGVASFSKDFGFSPETSAYDIYCHDDSGLQVNFSGVIVAWKAID